MKGPILAAQAGRLPDRGLSIREAPVLLDGPPVANRRPGRLPIGAKTATLLLLLTLPVRAQFNIAWHTIAGGGSASAGGDFTVRGTIGQPDAGVMSGGPFTVVGGFWALPRAVPTPGAPTLNIAPGTPGWAVISWTATPGAGWVLQGAPAVTGPWTDAPGGSAPPVTVPATLPAKFYRLIRP